MIKLKELLLEDDEKVKFFNYVDKNYSAKSETD